MNITKIISQQLIRRARFYRTNNEARHTFDLRCDVRYKVENNQIKENEKIKLNDFLNDLQKREIQKISLENLLVLRFISR